MFTFNMQEMKGANNKVKLTDTNDNVIFTGTDNKIKLTNTNDKLN